MTTVLCTLYNNLYLDKGLVLYDSLCECAKDFKLYVLCMDDKCYEVLTSLHKDNHIPVRLSDVENKQMIEAKSNRTIAEYFWTCSSRLVQYILETFQPECCTYIDADMYFYNDPQILVDEMLIANKSVLVVPHRFVDRNKHLAEIVGQFCVEFNTFRNSEMGLNILNRWHDECLNCCACLNDGIHWGDQKYLDKWLTLYPNDIQVSSFKGAGVGPWNVDSYTDYNKDNRSFKEKTTLLDHNLFFYHFESISFIDTKIISTGVIADLKTIDYILIDSLYRDYLLKIKDKQKQLELLYGWTNIIKHHPSSKISEIMKRTIKRWALMRKLKSFFNFSYKTEYEMIVPDD